jgi:hypothetical protein
VGAEQDSTRHAERDGEREACEHSPQRGEEVDRQIAGLGELDHACKHAFGPRQHVGGRGQRNEPPQREQNERKRDALNEYRHPADAAGGVERGGGAHGESLAFS